jgi:hypothetical protein
MTYILAVGELTVPTYSSRPKRGGKRRRINTSETPSRDSTQRYGIPTPISEPFTNVLSSIPSQQSTTTEGEVFPAPEPLRPVFCCTSVEPKNTDYMSKLSTVTSTLQGGRLYYFLDYIADYSQSDGILVVDDLKWSEKSEYLVKVLRYRQKTAPKSPTRKKLKVAKSKTGKGVKESKKMKWEQAAPGRYFVQMKHKKGQRWADHAFDEVLITEELEGIPACFEMIEEITMETVCPVHSGRMWICEFWRKIADK